MSNVKLKIPQERVVFAFGKDTAQLPAEIQITNFEDESPPFAITVRTLSQSVTLFLNKQEAEIAKTFFNHPADWPEHCTDC